MRRFFVSIAVYGHEVLDGRKQEGNYFLPALMEAASCCGTCGAADIADTRLYHSGRAGTKTARKPKPLPLHNKEFIKEFYRKSVRNPG